MTIVKLIFYLSVYNHWIACIWNIAIMENGLNTYFVTRSGFFENKDGMTLLDDNGAPVKYDESSVIYIGELPTFAD